MLAKRVKASIRKRLCGALVFSHSHRDCLDRDTMAIQACRASVSIHQFIPVHGGRDGMIMLAQAQWRQTGSGAHRLARMG
jgi:hypothetical protein